MVIYGIFPNSRPARAERPARQQDKPEQPLPEAWRDRNIPEAANDSSEHDGPLLVRSYFADWWPLIIAGIAVALVL